MSLLADVAAAISCYRLFPAILAQQSLSFSLYEISFVKYNKIGLASPKYELAGLLNVFDRFSLGF